MLDLFNNVQALQGGLKSREAEEYIYSDSEYGDDEEGGEFIGSLAVTGRIEHPCAVHGHW